MADPFSITGSAVGVVSLAIQVCKGLEWYLSGVKDAKNKVEQIAAETEELANLLESLESIISKADQSHAVSVTRTGLVSCANAISTIRKKLKPDDRPSDGGIKSSLKRLTKRLAFPFKEAEIKYWKDVLNTIQQSLQTALLALLIDQQRLASEDVRLRFTQLSMDQSAQHFSSLQLQRDMFDRSHLQLAEQSHLLESGFSDTSQSVQSLHADFRRFQAQLFEAMSATDATVDNDVMSMRNFRRRTRKLQRRYAKATCICRPQTSALSCHSRLLALTCSRTSLHDPQCPQSTFQRAVTNLQLQTTLCSLILGTKMSLAFTLSYGAKFSVNHNLECYRVVHKSSPAFAFIDTLVQSSEDMPQEVFQGEVSKLFRMFELGQASPHDRLPDGKTLLHVRVRS
jgi:hypothetical protein